MGELQQDVQRFKQALGREYAASFDATVVHGLTGSTLEGYGKSLARLARTSADPEETPSRRILEAQLVASLRVSKSAGPIKKLLVGVWLLEKIGWIQEGLVLRGDRLLVEAMERRLTKE